MSLRALAPMTRLISILILCAAIAPGQTGVGAGTLYQSLDQVQLNGVSSVSLPGNPSITTNEIVAWSSTEGSGLARSIFNAQQLGILLGDVNGDGAPFDWPNIDAFWISPPPAGSGRTQPSVFDARFSVSSTITNGGQVIATPGDVVRFTGVGTLSVELSASQLQVALGTVASLDIRGYALLPDGSALVSVGAFATGNNIVNPLNGTVGSQVLFGPGDVFIIRPPYGALPALFAYRQTELAVVVNFYYGAWFTVGGAAALGGIDYQQVFAGGPPPLLNNPNDPLNLYLGGTRPYLLWTIRGDDNVFCWDAFRNPLAPGLTNFYAIAGSGVQSVAGYQTNIANNRVFTDALCVTPTNLDLDSRLTLDTSDLTPTPGSTVQFSVRGPGGPGAASRMYQLGVSSALASGVGSTAFFSEGFGNILLDLADPTLQWSLQPLVAPMFQTAGSNPDGTATTINLTIPTVIPSGTPLHLQAVELGSTPNLTTALTLIVN